MRGVCNLLQLYLTLYDPMDCSLPGSSVHGILQARSLEWVALHVSRGSSSRRDWSWISYISCNWQAGSLPPPPPEMPYPRDTFSQISSQIIKIFSMDFLLNKPHERNWASTAFYRSTEAGDNRIERLECKGRESEESWLILFWIYRSPLGVSQMAQWVKNLSAMQETPVRFLGQEDPLEEGMATHSRIVAWRIPWTEEPGGLQSMGLQRVGHN